MSEVVVFHHARGLTPDVLAFAAALRSAGHEAHTPDLYDGATFTTLDEGLAHAEAIGFPTLLERGRRAADALAADLVYIGFSLGALPAQLLAQTRPGASAAVLAHSCVPPAKFGGEWPAEIPLQLHLTEHDPLALPPNTDLEAARALAASGAAELFLYPGTDHFFDAETMTVFTERVLAFLR
ncbi:dienelactone hydrolase family protein [Solirubrobacter sp. CPCC 204708]|uniref:Dienelactone hydrolase family protein n=1 Tax=Solirubrobacter deserti TaxID=2282478 RepID=A0ABT4REF4_9ACTN|nr:dienelactone hydrolase family protein [Solirubrobacter deserti]MBE2315954.1 dienelactone hydrolase family protein [Solirubrobacter deserti]MDA0136705.1 dienelactone hydrolase family protein [Solirubrobacter deserti]